MFNKFVARAGAMIERWSELQAWIASAFLILMVALITYGVLARYFFKTSMDWSIELPAFFLLPLCSFGVAFAQFKKSHVKVDFMLTHLPPVARRVLIIVSILGFIAVTWFVLRATFDNAMFSLKNGMRSEDARIPLFIFQVLLPIGMLGLVLQLLVDLAKAVFKGE